MVFLKYNSFVLQPPTIGSALSTGQNPDFFLAQTTKLLQIHFSISIFPLSFY